MPRPPKAYRSQEFLGSHEARTVRILCEYLEPSARFSRHRVQDTVVFFGSARALAREAAAELLRQAEQAGDEAEIARARAALELSRYYEDARALAGMLTAWSKSLPAPGRRFIVCSGGGAGIMEAANRGASEAGGLTVGLGISLPGEPTANRYISRELAFEFHYFFMRKFWFAYLAKAMVFFPGGFGTLDELFEILTLAQTGKLQKRVPVVLYGRRWWEEAVRFPELVRRGTVSAEDVALFRMADSPEEAFACLRDELGALYL